MSKCYALIVAAGKGTRLGGQRPKQYLPLAGKSILSHSVEALLTHSAIARVYIVYNPLDHVYFHPLSTHYDLPAPIPGGMTRQESSRLGLEHFATLPEEEQPDLVLIHDAVRPLVDHALITRIVSALQSVPAAIAAIPVVETLKQGTNGYVTKTVDRTMLWHAQSPQGFAFETILKAYRHCLSTTMTDDASVAEYSNIPVSLVMGSQDNIKVTTITDLSRAERLLSPSRPVPAQEVCVGFGYDVHPFGQGNSLMLCGIEIHGDQTLIGHSDGDVGLHALTDALLGTISAGDIGDHFPPTDQQWHNADSTIFLRHARNLIAECGGWISHVDVTLICEHPRISPYRLAMIRAISEILSLPPDRTSVKATTTERLGFIGRKEGIAAQAVATVIRPAQRSR